MSLNPLSRLGRVVGRRAWLTLVAWLALVVLAGLAGAGTLTHLKTDSGMDQSRDSYQAYESLKRSFPDRAPDMTVLYSSEELTVDDPAFTAAVDAALARLPKDKAPNVVNGLRLPPAAGMVSPDRHAVKVVVSQRTTDDLQRLLTEYKELRPLVDAQDPRVRTDVSGIQSMGSDLLDRAAADTARAELIALPIVFVLSVVIFGGVVAATLPTITGLVAIALSLAVLRGVTALTDVAVQSLEIVTLLGMGLAIDYSLFMITRFREELGGRRGRAAAVDALGRTLPTAGRTVLFSALVVSVSLAGLAVFPISTIRSMAYGAIPAILGSALAAVTLIPALLALLGHRINALRIPGLSRDDDHGLWSRLAHAVMRHPWAVLLATTALLLALAAPFAHVRWGGMDEQMLPKDSPARVALEQEAEHFGGRQTWAYAMVEGADAPAVARYAAELGKVADVRSVTPTQQTVRDGRPVTMLTITWPGTSQEQRSMRVVRDLRAVSLDGGRTLVGGPTALTLDNVDSMQSRLPAMLAVMVGAMLVLLTIAFRSLLLPLKAVLVSAVSIGASYGLLTLVFQDGVGAHLLGFDGLGYLDIMTPVVMVAILFGLSMDYEVFMISRMHEEWDRTGDNAESVARGLALTGRLITGAALLLAIVIGGFATSSTLMVKMLGLGMLVAVLLDATVVRCLLVPATMRLLGRWNWWLPGRRG